MRIAFVSFAFGEYSIRLCSALAEEDSVALWLPAAQAEPHVAHLDERVDLRTFDKPRMRQPIRQLFAISRLLEEIQVFDPDVVHIQQGYLWLNPFLRRLRHLPIVVTVHDPVPHVGDVNGLKTPQVVADLGFRSATALVVHNDAMRDVMVGRGFDRDRIHVVPTVARGHLHRAEGMQEDGNLVLFFGRIWRYKGLHHLINAEPLIRRQLPDVKIVIAGRGEDFGRYRRLMANPESFLVYNEYVDEDLRAELFQRSSVVVLPYIDATQSGVIATAYSFGKPVIASRVGGLPSMVEEGVSGLLVPPGDEAALAEAVVAVMSDAQLRKTLSHGARRKAAEEFSAGSVAVGTRSVYRSVREKAFA